MFCMTWDFHPKIVAVGRDGCELCQADHGAQGQSSPPTRSLGRIHAWSDCWRGRAAGRWIIESASYVRWGWAHPIYHPLLSHLFVAKRFAKKKSGELSQNMDGGWQRRPDRPNLPTAPFTAHPVLMFCAYGCLKKCLSINEGSSNGLIFGKHVD